MPKTALMQAKFTKNAFWSEHATAECHIKMNNARLKIFSDKF